MKQVTMNICTINELDDSAKEYAHEQWRANGEYHWIDESIDTVREFLSLFGLSLTDYSLSPYAYSYLKCEEITQEHIRGFRLKDLPETLTGYYLECSMLETFKKVVREDGDIKWAIQCVLEEATQDIIKDMEWQDSMDYFIELCEANDWGFYESGEFYGTYSDAA
jgi:hypothetical protein